VSTPTKQELQNQIRAAILDKDRTRAFTLWRAYQNKEYRVGLLEPENVTKFYKTIPVSIPTPIAHLDGTWLDYKIELSEFATTDLFYFIGIWAYFDFDTNEPFTNYDQQVTWCTRWLEESTYLGFGQIHRCGKWTGKWKVRQTYDLPTIEILKENTIRTELFNDAGVTLANAAIYYLGYEYHAL